MKIRNLICNDKIFRSHQVIGIIFFFIPVFFIINCTSNSTNENEVSPDTSKGSVIVVNSDIAVGVNRILFIALDSDGIPVRNSRLPVNFSLKDGTNNFELKQSANFVNWPNSESGAYVSVIEFPIDGNWTMFVGTTYQNQELFFKIPLNVQKESSSIPIGANVPSTYNKTRYDVNDIRSITSSDNPDLELYSISVGDAVLNNKYSIVTFASPMYCQTSTCGPQVDVLSNLRKEYKQDINFIHIEVYDRNYNNEGELIKVSISPILDTWGLKSEPYTFVLSLTGKVMMKYEGFVTEKELKTFIRSSLNID